jgi:hypothetical protein
MIWKEFFVVAYRLTASFTNFPLRFISFFFAVRVCRFCTQGVWTLMKYGQPSVPKYEEWLAANLPKGSRGKHVGPHVRAQSQLFGFLLFYIASLSFTFVSTPLVQLIKSKKFN